MNPSSDQVFSAGLQAGRLEGVALPDLFWALGRAKKTGILRLERKQVRKSVYLDAGRIVFATSNQQDDRLGELLLRQGRISLADLDAVVSELGGDKRIGTLLQERGTLTAEQLVDGVLTQVRRIVLELFEWEEGDYHFDEGPLPTDEVITLNMSTGELLLAGIRSIRSFARIRRSIGTPRTMYRLTDDWREALDGVRLSEGEELLVVRLEQGEESVEGLCREVFLSNFEIYQTLWGLKVLGAVEENVSLAESGDAEWQGSLADTHFADVLVRVAQRGETGILHVCRRMLERTFHFRDGRCIFATSNNPDDGLIAYLLRRGVISLSDREETAKRLLSNKRVGTILRELGVIDDRDLEEMVRQQLAEVVYDTFRWDDGDFAFYVGELPSIEEITLDASIEALVAEGVRRVQSWSRVMQGCGGLDYRLALAERYLDVLDGLDAGADEWQVVTALKEPQAARHIAATVNLPDFRICQILWTLRALQAIEVLPLEDDDAPRPSEPVEAMRVEVVDLDRPAAEDEDSGAVEEHAADDEVDEPAAAIAAEPADEDAAPAFEEEPFESEPEPDAEVYDETPDGNAVDTVRLTPEEVAAALENAPDDEPIEDPDWDPPEDLESSISRFNAMQRVVFRTVRSEVGAGAANFIRSCVEGEPNPVAEAELSPDGTWDVEGLRRIVFAHRVDEPWELYQRLIERELETLRSLVGETKMIELQRQVDRLGETYAD